MGQVSTGVDRVRWPPQWGYALRNWVALTRYTEDGCLKIDNNGAEQALRPVVLGRKNLFAGREAAAHRTAILCSLVQTCENLQINPFIYLREVIERVSTHPARLVLELTPRKWKRLRQDSATKAAAERVASIAKPLWPSGLRGNLLVVGFYGITAA